MLFAGERKYEKGHKNYVYLAPNDLFYDKENIFRCPDCNNIKFYIDNEFWHKCPINNKEIKITFDIIKNKENKFKSKINQIENKCIEHQREFSYYKDGNYYCGQCIREKNIKNYLILDNKIS